MIRMWNSINSVVVKDLRLEDKDLKSKDLQVGPRRQGLSSRTVNKTELQ